MKYTTRPLSDRTWFRPTSARTTSRFDSTWTKTLSLLGREIEHLRGRDVVIEVDIREQDLRLDGTLRANARTPKHPAVVVAFETTQHGPMLYRCDRFTSSYRRDSIGWQENVRAIALTLEALRSVDRYGATETGQQYTGFKAIGAGTAMPSASPAAMSADEAWSIIGSYQRRNISEFRAQHTVEELAPAWKRARAANHPDRRDGDRRLWDQVEQAAAVLGVLQ